MVDRWQSRTALSVDRGGRPTCTNVHCAHRSTVPVDRQKEQSSLFVPVDRQRVVTLCLGLRATARSTAFSPVKNSTVGGRPARSTDSSQSLLTDSNGYFLVCLLLGLLPMNILSYLTLFSSPINSESFLQLKYNIYRSKIKISQSLAF